jgi:sialic acid synthase SpsE
MIQSSLFANPFIIAEIGVNHEGSTSLCFKLINQALKYGFNAVKLQHIVPSEIWHPNYTLPTLSEKESLTNDELTEIVNYAHKCGILIGCTPTFQGSAQVILQSGCDFIKVASPQTKYDWFILDEAIDTNLPLVVSNGYCDYDSSLKLINYLILNAKLRLIAFLYCVSAYPADSIAMNYDEIAKLSDLCNSNFITFGFSDHNQSLYNALKMKHECNACVFEKHFSLENTKSLDKDVSIFSFQAAEYVRQLRMSVSNIEPNRAETLYDKSILFSSSFYLTRDVKQGDPFCLKDCRRLRDGVTDQLSTFRSHQLLIRNENLKYTSDLLVGHRLTESDLSQK